MLRVGFSPAGVLLWAALYFFLSGEELMSLLAAVTAHEIGHVLLLFLFGVRAEMLLLTGTGLQIDYSRALSPSEELFSALAGPFFGIIWFFAARMLGFELSAWLSFILTAFNLLPLSAMDGGRALHATLCLMSGEKLAKRVSNVMDVLLSVSMCAIALLCAYMGLGAGAALCAAWLIIYTVINPCKRFAFGIK